MQSVTAFDETGKRTTTVINGSLTHDFGSIAAHTMVGTSFTVTGAKAGDAVVVGAPSAINLGLVFTAYVSAPDTVTLRVGNITAGAIDPVNLTYNVSVIKQ